MSTSVCDGLTPLPRVIRTSFMVSYKVWIYGHPFGLHRQFITLLWLSVCFPDTNLSSSVRFDNTFTVSQHISISTVEICAGLSMLVDELLPDSYAINKLTLASH